MNYALAVSVALIVPGICLLIGLGVWLWNRL